MAAGSIWWKPKLSIVTKQCLDRRIRDVATLRREISGWDSLRNNDKSKINWQFTTYDAGIKLRTPCPSIQD
jgi:hypothetical protein